MFTQTYINHCSFKLIQSLAQLALGQLHNVTASETELAMIKKNAWNNSSITVEDLLGNSVSRFVQSGTWSWNQSEHRIFNFCTFRSTFFQGRSVKPYSALRPIRRLILEPMNAQYFCKVQSRSHRKTLLQAASNQSTVFWIFQISIHIFFKVAVRNLTLPCVQSNVWFYNQWMISIIWSANKL